MSRYDELWSVEWWVGDIQMKFLEFKTYNDITVSIILTFKMCFLFRI